ncbi:hypothetical protein C6500_01370 [Candidatus Poribacteria bacterium]|nr:MAG: hypothetical protein C6500_01370 [Candidatus Poribacteria bacterium]
MEFISANKKKTAIPLIWLLIYLSIVPMQLSNYVLCIGTDGHVEFEIAVAGRCTHTHAFNPEHADAMIAGTPPGEGHCGSCIDLAIFVPLNTQLYLVPTKSVSTHSTLSSFTLVAHQKRTSIILPLIDPQDFSPLISPTLVSLRTTTLLI